MKLNFNHLAVFLFILGVGLYLSAGKKPPIKVIATASETTDHSANAVPALAKTLISPPRAPSSAPTASTKLTATTTTRKIESKKQLLAAIEEDKKCAHTETCDFPKTDPRSYGFALARKTAEHLTQFEKNFAKESPVEARRLALEFSSSDDGYVQEAVLRLVHAVSPSDVSLKAVAYVVANSTDPGVIKQSMNELTRYVGTSEERLIHQSMAELLATGGVLTSQEASKSILPLLNASSVGFYENLLRGLPPGTEVARNLKLSLQEYRRKSTGG